mmetsp:Transcript_51533/g.109586  ORF Transcript_51533/g.109586 Transcript_51533/m.109586 type:complete len:93 (-) Transcript_51533:94-372(-)
MLSRIISAYVLILSHPSITAIIVCDRSCYLATLYVQLRHAEVAPIPKQFKCALLFGDTSLDYHSGSAFVDFYLDERCSSCGSFLWQLCGRTL